MATFFEIIDETLDRAYEDISEQTNPDKEIKTALEGLSNHFGNVLAKGGPSYVDPITRFAYVFRYAPAHADYLHTIILECPELQEILKRERIEITCVGGGPGSDVLGFLKFLLKQKKQPRRLNYFILDKEPGWGDTWAYVDEIVSEELNTSRIYLQCDVTDASSYSKLPKPFKADIFTLLYFLSELFKHKEAMTEFLATMFAKMKKGALVVVLDFHDSRLESWIDEIAQASGLETIFGVEKTLTMEPAEEKNALKAYNDKFGTMPKIQAQIFARVFRKTQ